jgi:predicted dehydrogenase
MADLLIALEKGGQPRTSGEENLGTMALVDACYRSASEHRAIEIIDEASNL